MLATLLTTLLSIIGPIMTCVMIGYFWKKLGWAYDTGMVTQLVMRIGAPCLVVASLSRTPISRETFEQMFLVTLAMLVVTALIAIPAIKLAKQPVRNYLGALLFPNTGNLGLPVCLFAFGEKGLTLALTIFMVLSVLHFTVGIALVSGKSMFRELLTNPVIYSIAIAVAMIYLHLTLPPWLGNTMKLLSDFTIPLMLLTLGVSLADMKMQGWGSSVYFAVARMVIGVVAGWGVAVAFGLHGMAKGVLIMQSSMPVAVFNYLFAVQYDRNPQQMAGMVMVSTLLSFVLIPLIYLYVQ